METLPQNVALLIIDVQKGLDDPILGKRNNPRAEENMAKLLAAWRETRRPVIHVQHMSVSPTSTLRPDHPGNAIKDEVKPLDGEPLFRKNVNSAFVGTDLENHLRTLGIDTVVVMGLTTPHCVSTTARMASDLGFRTLVVADAAAAHEVVGYDGRHHTAEALHTLALAALHGEFATIVETEPLLKSLA